MYARMLLVVGCTLLGCALTYVPSGTTETDGTGTTDTSCVRDTPSAECGVVESPPKIRSETATKTTDAPDAAPIDDSRGKEPVAADRRSEQPTETNRESGPAIQQQVIAGASRTDSDGEERANGDAAGAVKEAEHGSIAEEADPPASHRTDADTRRALLLRKLKKFEEEKTRTKQQAFVLEEPETSDRSDAWPISASEVRAGSHDDNEEFPLYQRYCARNEGLRLPIEWDVGERAIVRVVDRDSNCVPFAAVSVRDGDGTNVFSARTPLSGEIVLFPRMDLGTESDAVREYHLCTDNGICVKMEPALDGRITLRVPHRRRAADQMPVQVCFLLDATGSMRDEIRHSKRLRTTCGRAHSRNCSRWRPCRLSSAGGSKRSCGSTPST